MSKYILNFEKISLKEKPIVGGKAYNLSRLRQRGFAVPRGFVITSKAFDFFMKCNSLRAFHQVLTSDLSLKDSLFLANDLTKKILKSQLSNELVTAVRKELAQLHPKSFAVRSSASAEDGSRHSFAGQFESYINVKKSLVVKKIVSCFASLFSPRVVIYTHRKKIDPNKIKMAVVIHEMINPDIAGNLFTVNFLSKNPKQMLVETVKGSGDKITDGTGRATRLQINKDDFSLVKKNQKFYDMNVMKQLGRIGVEIEVFFGRPQEIEWAIKKNKIYILQSRPISFYQNCV